MKNSKLLGYCGPIVISCERPAVRKDRRVLEAFINSRLLVCVRLRSLEGLDREVLRVCYL